MISLVYGSSDSMNKTSGQVSWLSLLLLISLLLFKGVAVAAMLCCGLGHNTHPTAVETNAEHGHDTGHSHHSVSSPEAQQSTTEHQLSEMAQTHDHSSNSCSGCAVSCTAAVLLMDNPMLSYEQYLAERILSSDPLLVPLTSSGLDRPPRSIC
jgi:hypothetical protein